MKKFFATTLISGYLFTMMGIMNGMPFKHGLDPREYKGEFGMATMGLATSYPGAIAEHIQMFK